MKGPELSIVIPAFNEAGNLRELVPALRASLEAEPSVRGSYEICIIDDGSSDETVQLMRELHAEDARVRYLSFSRNFGQVTALVAGLHFARGRGVITMDADFQHPISFLPRLIGEWRAGHQIVNTLRLNQNGFFSRMFYRVYRIWTGIRIEPGFADFRLFDRRVVDAIKRHAAEEIFLRGLVPELGFRQVTLPYSCESRRFGTTKYTLAKNLRLAVRGLVSQAKVGFSLPFYLSVASLGLGFLTPKAAIAVGSSFVLLVLGIFGVYLRRMYLRLAVKAPAYIVGETSDDAASVMELQSRAG